MALTKEELNEELEKVDDKIQKLNDNLIKALQDIGIEYLDLYNVVNFRKFS